VASAKAVVKASFPVVATTSAGVAAALGYEDHEGAPADEMLSATARIARSVEVPVTVDAEAGYGMTPGDLVDALLSISVAGCNLEDTDHPTGGLIDMDRHAEWLAAVRTAATDRGYGLVINARIDVFLAGRPAKPDGADLDEALIRARSYRAAGVDCVYPILLQDADAIAAFVDGAEAPVNILALPQAPPIARLAELGVARISYGPLVHRRAMQDLATFLGQLTSANRTPQAASPE
jgi:2-methylisocitrate lyase-like PEP mutase family enzyme